MNKTTQKTHLLFYLYYHFSWILLTLNLTDLNSKKY